MSYEIATAIAFISIPAIFTFISFSLDEEHIFLKFLLLFSSLSCIILGINTVRAASTVDSRITSSLNAVYNIAIWLSVMVFIYFFIFFIRRSFQMKKEREEEEYE